MLVTRVELENIKSYRHLAIDFRPGTTAISGSNGAGKTTIVEAIGFALFDSLPYSQKLFVREGENFGKVVVHLVGNDDRTYTVERRCGSGAFWMVFDREADLRVEQRADVQAKLYELLGVERERSLKRLFEDALGVQQGRFTSSFLLNPADRKKSFDALFQIEDYKNAADYLLGTKNDYEKQLQAQELIITELTYKTENLEEWRQTYEKYREEEQNQHALNASLLQQLAAQNTRREQLESQSKEVSRLEREFSLALSNQQLAVEKLTNAQINLEKARAAQDAVQASLPHHQAYQEAEQHLRQLRNKDKQRAILRQQRADRQNQQTRFQTEIKSWEGRLKEIEQARRKVSDLTPLVERQIELEGQREKLSQQVHTLENYRNEYRKFATRQKQEEVTQEKLRQQIASIEPLQPLADLLTTRMAELTELNTKLAGRSAMQAALETRQRQHQLKIADCERYTGQLQKDENNIARIEAHRHEAETYGELQEAHNRLSEQRFRLEGNLEGYEKARKESGDGLCPFLREPCLNIQKRGENSLETYFDGLLITDRATLTELAQKQSASTKRLDLIKKYADALDRLDQYQQRRDESQAILERLAEELTQLEEDMASLRQDLANLSASEQKLPSLKKACEESKQADQQVRRLDGLKSQLKQFEEQAGERIEQMRTLRLQIQELSGSQEELDRVDQFLTDLSDPRSSRNGLQATIKQEDAFQQKLEASRQGLREVEQQLGEVEQSLSTFDTLDQEISAQEERQRQAQGGHRTYIQNEQAALQLPGNEKVYEEAHQKASASEQQFQLAERDYQVASAAFQPEMLNAVAAEYSRLNEELSGLAVKMENLQEDLVNLKGQIQRAETFLVELEAARKEENTLDELQATLERFRKIMKEAAPFILKALLSDISAEANRIFGEIMGDRSAHLAWLNDYEIQLNRKGVNRSFHQLSGGEQMSAALAIRLALLKKLSNLNIAFFDEPTQNMDELRRMNLAEQIRRVRGFDQLIVISHDDTFEQGLDSIVRLKKVDGETQLMSEEEVMMQDDQERIYAS